MRPDLRFLIVSGLFVASFATGEPVLAHTNPGVARGLLSGFTHPLSGLDHMLAMVAVGIWGTQLGQPAVWLLPVTFPLVMAVGGAFGVRGVPLPIIEIGVAASALALGFLIALRARPPLAIAAAIVGGFAVFHGYAHGTELPTAAAPLAYGLGFVLVTGMLHAAGIAIGLVNRWRSGAMALRATGAVIGAAGAYLLLVLVR